MLSANRFAKLCPVQEDKTPVLIIDDTPKEKTGRKGESHSWFVDHCKQKYMGYQTIVSKLVIWLFRHTFGLRVEGGKKKSEACKQKPLS